MAENKKTLTVTQQVKELVYDIQNKAYSFFVMNVTAKWYTFTNKEEAAGYATEAATYMEDIMRKAFFKRKPMRPTYE
jgi:hypothetical protein